MTTDTKEDPARSESEATPRKTWSAPKLEIFGIWSETGAKGSAVTESSTTKNSS